MPTSYQTDEYRDYLSRYQQPVASNLDRGTYNIRQTNVPNSDPAGQPLLGYSSAVRMDPQKGQMYNPMGGYTYTTGMRGSDFVKQNVKQDLNPFSQGSYAPNGNFILGVSTAGISQIPRALSGYRAYKKQQKWDRAQEEAWNNAQKAMLARAPTEYLGSVDPTSQAYLQAQQRQRSGDLMSLEELQQAVHQEQQAKQRGQYEQAINAYFDDPARAGWQQQIIQDRLNNDLAQVSDQYGQDLQRSVQGAAARGMRGGSTDVEGRGDVARVRDTRAIGAAADADAQRSAFQNRDLQERNNLMGLVNSRGITEGQQLSQALQGIHANTAAEGANYATRQRQQEIDRFGQQSQSQAWGQGLNSIAGSIRRQNPQNNTQGGW